MENTEIKKERAVLAGLSAASMDEHERSTEVSMEELAALVETAGGETVAMLMQSRPTPDARSFIGDGKVREMKELIAMNDCDLAVFDNELSPSQMRVLSEELGVKVLDRSGLILDIFAQRAQTREGQLQVELAQYKYLLPRLTGMWGHLVRQTASGGKSPIGTRGPGETQLETDRRHIRRKIQKLEEDLKDVRRVRAVQRDRRIKNEVPVVAIVGGVLPEVEDLCDDPALGLTAVFSINRQAMDFAQSRYASRENYTYTLNSILRLLRAAETK